MTGIKPCKHKIYVFLMHFTQGQFTEELAPANDDISESPVFGESVQMWSLTERTQAALMCFDKTTSFGFRCEPVNTAVRV